MIELASRLAEKGREEARRLLERAIELGSVSALCDLALLLEDESPEESCRVLEDAASKGSVKAMLIMSERCAASNPGESKRLIERAKSAQFPSAIVQLSMTSGMSNAGEKKSVPSKSMSVRPMDDAWKVDLVDRSGCHVIARLANVLASEDEKRAEAVFDGLIHTLCPELLYRLSIVLEKDQARMALVALRQSAYGGFAPAVERLAKAHRP